MARVKTNEVEEVLRRSNYPAEVRAVFMGIVEQQAVNRKQVMELAILLNQVIGMVNNLTEVIGAAVGKIEQHRMDQNASDVVHSVSAQDDGPDNS